MVTPLVILGSDVNVVPGKEPGDEFHVALPAPPPEQPGSQRTAFPKEGKV